MLRKASQNGLAASVTGATVPSTSLITYTTLDPHNLYPGARVTITGLSSTGDSANLTNALISRIDSPTSFSVGVTFTSVPTVTLAGGTGVYGTMYAPNGSLNLYNVKYAQPVATTRPTYYNYVYPSISTQGIGSGILVSWSASGIANPTVGTTGITVYRIAGTTTTTLTSASPGSGSYFDTSGVYSTGTSNTFTYRVTSSNSAAINTSDVATSSLSIGSFTLTTSVPANTANAILLSWIAPSTNAAISNYEYQRADDAAFTVNVVTNTALSSSLSSYTDTTVVAGSTYYYRVRARADYTYSSTAYNIYSTYATSTGTQAYAINVPTSLAVSTVASTANRLSVSWSAPSTSYPAVTGYVLQEATSTDNATWSSWTTVQSSSATSYSNTAATSGVYYRYQVQAVSTQLSSSFVTSTGVRAFYIVDPLTAPTTTYQSTSTTALVISGASAGNPAISGYTIRRSSDGGTNWTNIGSTTYTLVLPYTDTSVSSATSYVYQIKAKNSELTTANWSSSSTALTTYSKPTTPTGLTATSPSYNTVNLSWTASTSSTDTPVLSYKIERATNSGFSSGLTTLSTTVTAVTYSDTTAASGTTYYYRVSALNSISYSSASSSATATTASQSVNTTTTINSISAVTFGSVATVSGSVSTNPGGGSVTIKEGSTTLATASVVATTGNWSVALPTATVGSHSVTASFATFGVYQASTATSSYTVNQITTSVTAASGGSTYPTAPTVTGTVTPNPGSGTVQLLSGATVIASAAINAADGTYTITSTETTPATYSSRTVSFTGTTNYAASTSGAVSYTVAKAGSAISVGATAAINSGSATTLTASLGYAGATVSFYYNSSNFIGSAVTDSSGNASISWSPGAGTWTITSTWAGDTYYNGATSSGVSQYVRTFYTALYNPAFAASTWSWYGSTSTASQVGATFTMPSPSGAYNLTVSSINVSMAGYSGNQARVIGCLWSGASPGALLSTGGTQYIASASGGGATYQTLDLTDVAVSGGTVYTCGFWRYHTSTSYYTQWDIKSSGTGNTMYYDNSASAAGSLNHDTTYSGQSLLFQVSYYYWA